MTEFGARAAQPFGKRQPATSQSAQRSAAASGPPRSSSGGGEVEARRDDWFVPTKLLPILFGGVAVVVVQLLLGQILGLNGPVPTPGAEHRGFTGSDLETLVRARSAIAFLALILIYQGCHLAALYAIPAHAVLRWLKVTSMAAYAVGGLCAAFVWLAFAAMQGDRITWATGGVELVGGALAGAFYRLFAGLRIRVEKTPD
jgi:hypothetical protein